MRSCFVVFYNRVSTCGRKVLRSPSHRSKSTIYALLTSAKFFFSSQREVFIWYGRAMYLYYIFPLWKPVLFTIQPKANKRYNQKVFIRTAV